MAVFSKDYQQQLKDLHAQKKEETTAWGTGGARNFGDYICKFLEHHRGTIRSVLDFGAGQRSLGKYVAENAFQIDVKWTDYDPGITGIDTVPTGQFDLIVSSDVMEHLEPEMVDEAIEWQKAHANKALYHRIACSECSLRLPDGRNAHLSVHTPQWWFDKYTDGEWGLMFSADCIQMRRGKLAPHALVQLDRLGS